MRTADLRAVGMSRRNIDAAVAVGTLQRIASGLVCGARCGPARREGGEGRRLSWLCFCPRPPWGVGRDAGCDPHSNGPQPARVASGLRRCLPDIGHEHVRPPPSTILWMALRCARRCLSDDDFIVVANSSLVNRRLMALADIRATIGPVMRLFSIGVPGPSPAPKPWCACGSDVARSNCARR